MQSIHRFLMRSGWEVYSINLIPSSGELGIDELALQLHDFIKQKIKHRQQFDIIGFSMGGLVSQYYIQKIGGCKRINHFISISTPHNGTMMGYLSNTKGGRQMRYRSPFIQELRRGMNSLRQLKFTSIWTPFDLMIFPASSSKVPFGHQIKIGCVFHPWMVSHSKCLKAIHTTLIS